jgi:uncharacterized membrane protein
MVDRVHFAFAGTRVLVSALTGLVVFAVAATLAPWPAAVLLGWDTSAAVFLAWVLWVAHGKDAAATASLATRQDDSRAAADAVLVAASLASLVGVGIGLVEASRHRGVAQAVITALAVLTVVLSWAAVHALFTLRYARLYYGEHGGIEFNGGEEPDYHDFAYMAFTIGMTYQVSDTDLTTKSMRRTVTRHALLSYLFGTFVVAMMINALAGLLR